MIKIGEIRVLNYFDHPWNEPKRNSLPILSNSFRIITIPFYLGSCQYVATDNAGKEKSAATDEAGLVEERRKGNGSRYGRRWQREERRYGRNWFGGGTPKGREVLLRTTPKMKRNSLHYQVLFQSRL